MQRRIWVNNYTHVLQGKPDLMDNLFLAYSLHRADIASFLVGGSRVKLNANTLMTLGLLLPSVVEQAKIGRLLDSIDNHNISSYFYRASVDLFCRVWYNTNTMNIATFLTEKNNEYLNLIQACSKSEKTLSDRLFAVTNDISKASADFERRVAEINAELAVKTETLIVNSNEDIKITIEKIKQQRNVSCANEEQRKADIIKEYNLKLSQIVEEHNEALQKIARIYSRQSQDLDENYNMQLFILSNSEQVSEELLGLNSDMEERATEQKIEELQKKIVKTKNAIEQELENYKDRLKESLRFSKIDNQPKLTLSSELIRLVQVYYDSIEEINISHGTTKAGSKDGKTSILLSKLEIDEAYTREKDELEQSRESLIKEENAKYEIRKAKIEREKDVELNKVTSFDAEQKKFDVVIKEITAKLDKELNVKLVELKAAYSRRIADFSAQQQCRIGSLNKAKCNLTQQIQEIQERNRLATKGFLDKTKSDIDSLLEFDYDYSIGAVKNYSDVNTLPDKICIGKQEGIISGLELIKVLYGTESLKYNVPIILDVRKKGNVIINSTVLNESNEVLYRIVCGLTLKYLESFPLGSLKVHFVDANQHIWFNKFVNSFLRENNSASKHIITNESKMNTSLERVNSLDCEAVLRKTVGDIQDLFDLYQVDKTQSFNLFVIRSGFSEVVESGNIETLRILKNLVGERGAKCGVRFILVNDFKEDDRIDDRKKQLLEDILSKCFQFKFVDDRTYLDDSEITTTKINQGDAESFIEEECLQMALFLSAKQGDKITYEDIGFGKLEVKDRNSSVLSIPVGKFGSEILEIPFNCGDEKDGPANSGYIAMGRTNSGKSSFFHSLVINGCMKYSPNDLQFWLLDFKKGVASSNYEKANIPHIKLLSKYNEVDDAYCLFNLLKMEMDRRGELLNTAGKAYRGTTFQDLREYNQCVDVHPEFGAHMSRIIVVIDEAQEMFSSIKEENDDLKKIGALIGYIAVKSRYVGIHMVMIVQNLSMGKSYILRDSFVCNIKGKVVFNVNESCIGDSGFGLEFCELKAEINSLCQGEGYITCNDTKPVRVKMAFAPPADFEKYFIKIREKYGAFATNMIAIGNKSPLSCSNSVKNENKTYMEIISHPIIKAVRNANVYTMFFGEDAYSLRPVGFTFNSTMSCFLAIGSDVRMLSSICCSLLIGVDNIEHKIMHICNGGGAKEYIFNDAIKHCKSSKNQVYKYKMSEIDQLVKNVYLEFLSRKKLEEDGLVVDYDPIFVIINDISSISKVKANVDLKELDSEEEEHGDYSFDEMSESLHNESVDDKDSLEDLEGHNILDVIKELCIEGSSVSIYFNFTSKNADIYEIEDIFKKTSNKVIFNEFPADLSDANLPSYIIRSMLSSIRNDVETGETLAVSVINGVASKIRPILF